jgi:NAD+ diphosphatase
MIHTFAGNNLDRADSLRRDENEIHIAAERSTTRYLPFSNLNVLVNNTEAELTLGWLSQSKIAELNVKTPPILLGLEGDVAHFAIDLSELAEPELALCLDSQWSFMDCRIAAIDLPDGKTGVLSQSRAQLDWHARHQFCSKCGHQTQQKKGGHTRHCSSCKADHFPRTDPVVIMLITDGERCLLGQSVGRLANSGIYSTLAGFVDQGESIEEAVRREIKEEAGIIVDAVQYHSSQPWPFPSSLMIGCTGQAITTEITIDPVEMADVRWFTRSDVALALNKENKNLRLPGPFAIAHHLIKSWIEEDNLGN